MMHPWDLRCGIFTYICQEKATCHEGKYTVYPMDGMGI